MPIESETVYLHSYNSNTNNQIGRYSWNIHNSLNVKEGYHFLCGALSLLMTACLETITPLNNHLQFQIQQGLSSTNLNDIQAGYDIKVPPGTYSANTLIDQINNQLSFSLVASDTQFTKAGTDPVDAIRPRSSIQLKTENGVNTCFVFTGESCVSDDEDINYDPIEVIVSCDTEAKKNMCRVLGLLPTSEENIIQTSITIPFTEVNNVLEAVVDEGPPYSRTVQKKTKDSEFSVQSDFFSFPIKIAPYNICVSSDFTGNAQLFTNAQNVNKSDLIAAFPVLDYIPGSRIFIELDNPSFFPIYQKTISRISLELTDEQNQPIRMEGGFFTIELVFYQIDPEESKQYSIPPEVYFKGRNTFEEGGLRKKRKGFGNLFRNSLISIEE